MNILFIMRHSGYVRNFESTLRLLCERDHRVHLAFQIKARRWLLDVTDTAQQLCAEYPNFSHGMVPLREDGWGLLGRQLRLDLDYLRYLTPEYRDAPKLRRRAEQGVDDAVVRAARRGRASRWCLARALRLMDRSLPRSLEIDRFIDDHRPDLLLVTPLVRDGSPQSDYVRSARAQGVRTVFCVASWDNLTNKGLIHERFDLVTCWNEAMKREAVDLHGVPPNRVAVTGAQPFDHWFGRQPSTSREAFCARVGLSPDQPYLLYLCSSTFVAPDEAPFVRTWVQQLRGAASEVLRRAGVLVRPHPQNASPWHRFDASGLTNVAIHPPMGETPVDAASKADYFDSIYHSAAVVAVNTTAEIESAIVGRDVYTLLAPEFRETQEGTLHFHHLRHVNGGLLHVADNFPDHLAHLDAALRGGGTDAGRRGRFVEAFVRPYGVDVPATQKLVEALEAVGARPAPRPERPPLWAPLVRPLLRPLAARARREEMAAAAGKARRAKAKRKQRAHIPMKTPNASTLAREEVPAPSALPSPPPAAPHKPERGVHRVSKLVRAFQALAYPDRCRFVRANIEHIPAELWSKMQSSKAGRLDYGPVEIMLRVTSGKERQRLHACAKEPFTVTWIESMVGAGDVLYDIGANVGAYSLIAAKKLSGAARVFAFEPSVVNISALCHNIVLNKLTSEITPLPIALSNTNGLGRFNLRDLDPGSARHMLEADSPDGPTLYAQPVITYRLDDLIEFLDLPVPNHIKLDVDGCEMGVLEGATRTLESPALKSILVEVSMELSVAVATFIEARGLKMSWRARIRSKAGVHHVWYGAFVRNPEGPLALPTRPAVEIVA